MRTILRTLPLGVRLSEIQLQIGVEIQTLRHEISTLKGNDHDVALLTVVDNRLAQESSLYLLWFWSYCG